MFKRYVFITIENYFILSCTGKNPIEFKSLSEHRQKKNMYVIFAYRYVTHHYGKTFADTLSINGITGRC